MNHMHKSQNAEADSPFFLHNQTLYQKWRERKLKDYPKTVDELLVPVRDLANLKQSEKNKLTKLIQKTNMAVYESNSVSDKNIIRAFCQEFGLNDLDHNLCSDEDGISALKVVPGGTHADYIPYSNHAIRWHTDGYYNTLEHSIYGMLLHCVRPAGEGGANRLMDPEIAYLLIRDTNVEYIQALMQPDAMTIPANVQNGEVVRPSQSGPVFSVSRSGDLHMRYTARTRSIEWKQDDITKKAVRYLEQLLSSDTPFAFELRMQAGQGVLSNNVLHTRTAFTDSDKDQRLMYRARFYNRITGTGVNKIEMGLNAPKYAD